MTTFRHPAVAVLFVRQPLAGRVKTRLARDLGDGAACRLYLAMVTDCIAHVRSCGLPLFLFHDGRESAALPPEWHVAAEAVISQEGDSLGERMAAAFERLFAAGADRVLLAGSDIPGLDAGLLQSAIEGLGRHDAVFSPAPDGGYCLVALRRSGFSRSIFEGIAWSTSAVLAQTLAACGRAGLTADLLEARQDIDTIEDLAAYCRKPCSTAAATNAWLVLRDMMEAP